MSQTQSIAVAILSVRSWTAEQHSFAPSFWGCVMDKSKTSIFQDIICVCFSPFELNNSNLCWHFEAGKLIEVAQDKPELPDAKPFSDLKAKADVSSINFLSLFPPALCLSLSFSQMIVHSEIKDLGRVDDYQSFRIYWCHLIIKVFNFPQFLPARSNGNGEFRISEGSYTDQTSIFQWIRWCFQGCVELSAFDDDV